MFNPEIRDASTKAEQVPAEWQAYAWKPEAQRQVSRPIGAGISAYARRMMARERARIQQGNLPALR